MSKRVILVGPSATGKTFIKYKLGEKGFKLDVSYTSRDPRKDEIDGVDYNFISKSEFIDRIERGLFYEYAQHGESLYGTGLSEWHNSDVFIMESHGVSKIIPEDRKESFVIYVNIPFDIRLDRMRKRGWTKEMIQERTNTDQEKFKNFRNFDVEISSCTQE